MFKELFTLIKMLFATSPKDITDTDLEVIYMKHFPFKNVSAMMWCGKAICRKEDYIEGKDTLSKRLGTIIATHEYGHLVQSQYEGSWIKYYLKYLWHWFKHNPFYKYSYWLNRYEVEAFAKEECPEYWLNYDGNNLKTKYNFKKAKKVFKEKGVESSIVWKRYIKTL